MTILRATLIFLVLLTGKTLEAQIESHESKIHQILNEPVDRLAESFLKDTLMKSLSIGVYYKGDALIRHFGELDEGKDNKPTNKTIYDIGSVTKTFVGTLMAKAELAGKLSIEDDIRDYLDGEYPNLQFHNQAVKIKHLITHTSGLPQFLPLSVLEEFSEPDVGLADRISKKLNNYSKRQFLEDLKTITIDTLPGIKYAYSNAGAELASYILERAYGIPFERLLEEQLLRKANMTSTSIALTEAQKQFYANGYGDFNNQTPPMESTQWGGSGYGKSTLPDLLNYIKYHLTEEKEVKRSHQTLFDKEIIHGAPRNKLGYMWEISTDGDFGRYLNHHGGSFGVQNWIMVYPEEEMGISIITNQSGRQTAGKLHNFTRQILSEIAKVRNASDKTETEQITETLMDYIEGSTKGQPNRLKKAFHTDLNLYYIWDREFRVWSGKAYIEDTKEGEPTGETGEILSIDYENDIATAKIRIAHPESQTPYIDYLMLIKTNGHWVILHKMFTQEKSK